MKIFQLLLSASILFAGCYTQSSLTKDEDVPGNQTVVFYLKDGSSVESKSGNHNRSVGGYQVEGTFFTNGDAQGRFEGMIHDADIERVTTEKLDLTLTIVAGVASTAACLAMIGATIYYMPFSWH